MTYNAGIIKSDTKYTKKDILKLICENMTLTIKEIKHIHYVRDTIATLCT